jgi:hypothetical protein
MLVQVVKGKHRCLRRCWRCSFKTL